MKLSDILARVLPAIFDGPYTDHWLHNAPTAEIEEEREKLRIPAVCKGDEKAARIMNIIDNELIRRMNEEYTKAHPNAKTVHHEHGWYLESDDQEYTLDSQYFPIVSGQGMWYNDGVKGLIMDG